MAKIELSGMDELIRVVESLGPKAGKVENDALRAGGKVLKEGIEEEIRRQNLIDKGTMLGNVTVSAVKEGGGGGKYVDVGPGKKAWYWKFLEFGTSKRPATPFVHNTAVAKAREILQAMEAVFWRALER